ncbi:hypothetical protein [Aquimarina brevivitae]|uniref:Uncharacterized protein n=1 Tax=Aquimarina brevivitae TaxID=323412 RepID=A0A4Q7PJ84_9FLAO|nr:hypothetical protein [Aquimarina brevivitae]RZS99900.1 hypothetical protein EV197_1131 [Aquimarina brevivitae]
MRIVLFIIVVLSTFTIEAQTKEENKDNLIEKELDLLGDDIPKKNTSQDSTATKKSTVADTTQLTAEQEIAAEKEEKQLLKKMANQRAIELQNELNLSNYVSHMIEKAIYKYSVQANKVIQSPVSKQEKSIQLSNIIYFQNEEFKKYMTPQQFYDYINSWPNRQ